MFPRVHLHHVEQEAEHVEPVAARQSGQFGRCLRNESRSLVRPALAWRLIGSRMPTPARGFARPPAPCFGQKTKSNTVCL
jgi:hypothetical protein